MSKDASIGWMYDGAKGNVHREDYLLGKKVDKNFEKYSDVVNAEKAENIDAIVSTRAVFNAGPSTGIKTSSLQKDIIKSEDPFVLIKVREETKRREIMDNPLTKMKMQNALKDLMARRGEKKKEKKEKKSKKDKKKKKKRSRSTSESSSDEKEMQEKRSPSLKRKRKVSERSEEPRNNRRRDSSADRQKEKSSFRERSVERSRVKESSRRRDSSGDRRKERRRSRDRSVERSIRRKSRSPKRDRRSRSRSEERRRSPKRERSPKTSKKETRETRRKTRSRSRSEHSDKPSSSKRSRQFDSHIPKHLQINKHSTDSSSDSDPEQNKRSRRQGSDDEREESKKKAYGLVEMRKRTAEEREEEAKTSVKEYKSMKIPTGRGERGTGDKEKRREPRRALTDEEKAARLAEMQKDNVQWRDDVRAQNVARKQKEDAQEADEAEKNGYAPSFIRSQMRDACDDMTVEKRLQSRKGAVQKSHGYMDRSFARK